MRPHYSGFLILAGVALSACAVPQQLELIEREQRRLRTEFAAVREDVDSARANLADTRANLAQLQSEIGALKGKVDEVESQTDRQIGQSNQEGVRRLRNLESQLVKLENELKAQGATLQAKDDELRALKEAFLARQLEREAAATAARSADDVRRNYEEAFSSIEQNDYRAAIGRFGEFLKKHSNSEYADNAQYWIGESHYALREFDQAILAFDVVRRKYPQGDKVPAALLKMGFAFAELGDKIDARLILQELVDRYPQSEEAAKASQRLKTL